VKIALVVGPGIPNPDAGGATLTNWTLASYLLERGHDVVVVPFAHHPYYDPSGTTFAERVAALAALGARVEPLESRAYAGAVDDRVATRARRIARATPAEVFPYLVDRDALDTHLRSIAPDVVFAYHWEALSALFGYRGTPKVGVAVDLAHLPPYYRWRATHGKGPRAAIDRMRLAARGRVQKRLMVEFMNDCVAAGNFAAHHAAWLRHHGARCEYLRTPVPDPLGDGWRGAREAALGDRPRILLIGHLRGIATMEGLDVFAHEVLPRLEDALGPDGFEVHLVGGYEPHPEYETALDRPSVTFCGHVRDAAAEFLGAHVMVVPTSIELGTRVRILSAFAHGCAVVAHSANALGIPELANEENILLGDRSDELADGVVRVTRDPALRSRLEGAGRATYERGFAPPSAAAKLEELLARAARESAR
jgi:glycosyltransferase involved in cell wall biosynthesis